MARLHSYILSNLTHNQRLELIKWYKQQVHAHDCKITNIILDISSPGKEVHASCDCGHFIDLTNYNGT